MQTSCLASFEGLDQPQRLTWATKRCQQREDRLKGDGWRLQEQDGGPVKGARHGEGKGCFRRASKLPGSGPCKCQNRSV